MRLWFQRGNGERRLLGNFKIEQEATKAMYEFCRERDFCIHYTRIWEENGEKWFDVGSWNEFFIITDTKNETEEI